VGKGAVIWFTGLSGSGKSTVALAVKAELEGSNISVQYLDGDEVRKQIRNSGFSKEERDLHLRYMAYTASLLEQQGIIVLCAFVSPFKQQRDFARQISREFIEVYLSAPLEVCESRDPKGLYARARRGEYFGLSGLDAPYEPAENAEVVIRDESIEVSRDLVLKELGRKLAR